jgi:hypothetical protein
VVALCRFTECPVLPRARRPTSRPVTTAGAKDCLFIEDDADSARRADAGSAIVARRVRRPLDAARWRRVPSGPRTHATASSLNTRSRIEADSHEQHRKHRADE